MSKANRLAVFPGTFDPITNGHLDVIKRGMRLFDELVVAVGNNPEKAAMLDAKTRVEVVRQSTVDIPGVRVEMFSGLTIDFAASVSATVILRGIRDSSDLHFEYDVALTNRVVAGIETVFIIPSTEHAFTSSSLIKQIARMGGDVSAMVPPAALPHLKACCNAPGPDNTLNE
ncbi:MAG: pantetheine-phosphate adenylyltransferase [Phycisphaerae bacterium]|nr:pantetheine-phosphate adenylyltransferase [Planctomycetota bacterium]MBL7218514.1 pantetheine-phosphate adenylyltransferase [Phycisphaerae bacterium]